MRNWYARIQIARFVHYDRIGLFIAVDDDEPWKRHLIVRYLAPINGRIQCGIKSIIGGVAVMREVWEEHPYKRVEVR